MPDPEHHHHHHDHQESQPLTRTAMAATAHCLIGCGIGEVLGMAIATALGWGNAASIALAVALAFAFGYAFTLFPLLKGGMDFRTAAAVAFASDTVSIAVMEVADNAVMLLIPGAMDAGLTDPLFWGSLAASLAVAFVAALPANRCSLREAVVTRWFTPTTNIIESAGKVPSPCRRKCSCHSQESRLG